MSNDVLEFPIRGGDKPLQVARSLVDYVKNKPNAQIVCIIKDPDEGSITAGWSAMDAGDIITMIEFGRYRWLKSTFTEMDK